MRRLLVTGGAGFIGSNFIRYWLSRHPDNRIVNLDKLTYAGDLENLAAVESHPSYRFVQGDICDFSLLDALFRSENINFVIHFAAESHVDRSILGPEAFIRTNVHGTFTLLEAVRRYWKSGVNEEYRFLHISSDEVYGDRGKHSRLALCGRPLRGAGGRSGKGTDRGAIQYWRRESVAEYRRCQSHMRPPG